MTIRFDQFVVGNDVKVGDLVVGLRNGANTIFTFPNDGVKDANNNFLLNWQSDGVNATNYISLGNNLFNPSGNGQVTIRANSVTGSGNTSVNLRFTSKGAQGVVEVYSFFGTHMVIPSGTTAQQITGRAGALRYNLDNNEIEYWNANLSMWVALDAGSISTVTASAPLASSGGINPNISLTGIVSPAHGGTGADNGTSSLILDGDLETTGGFTTIFNFTDDTDVTFPTSGTLAVAGSNPPWTDQNTSTRALAPGGHYITNNGATLVTYTLPTITAFGDTYTIAGGSAGGWKLQCNAGQIVISPAVSTTSGGNIQNLEQADCISLVCIVANTTFNAFDGTGNYTWS